MKQLSFIQRSQGRHWVGDGFPVRSIFSYNDLPQEMSPFLLLDHAGPANFEPTTARRGVGRHPHRGFETVTIVYAGEVEHRDSTGAGGVIGPGDVQWMTAGSGIVHEEYHGADYARRGGPFEMVQLWVNLPARDKMAAPGYQGIAAAQIPQVELPGGAGTVRVIAGALQGATGPARSFSPMNVWDLRLAAGRQARLPVPAGHTTALFVLKGAVRVAGGETVGEAELAVLERDGDTVMVEALQDATLLLLGGEPLREPVVGHGPFVMNTQAEIRQAFLDHQSGRLGRQASTA
ncbi:pirin family protein [Methylibium sp.]|uniref:pirin family protein n=1 Tax=Methylibium sp. TaxID=2067992 RepID=UPI003D12EABE